MIFPYIFLNYFKKQNDKELKIITDDDENNEQLNNQRKNLSKDYFSDFDKLININKIFSIKFIL